MRAEQWRRVTDKVNRLKSCSDYPSVNTRATQVDCIGSTQKTRINALFLTELYSFKFHVLPFHVYFHYIMRLCEPSA